MLHTKFQGNRPRGSGEDILRFLQFMGMVAILVMWPQRKNINFLFPFARRLHRKYNSNWPSSFGGKPFENVDRQLTCELWPS